MLDRRDFILSAAVAALTPIAGAGAQPVAPGAATEAGKMNAMFDGFVQELMRRSPELATGLGLDNGVLAPLKSRLSEASMASVAKDKADNERRLAALKTIDRIKLSGADAASYDTVMFVITVQEEASQNFDYGGGSPASPYILTQLTGAYQQIPDFLDTQHSIQTKDDADAYLARLDAFATELDQELEVVRHDAGKGVMPPDFIIEKTLIQMQAFLDTPADKATIVQSLVRRASSKNLASDYGVKAAAIYVDRVLPALQRQASYLREIRPKAVHDAGVARLPKGADYYRLALKYYTTSSLTPDEIHQTGLDLVDRLSSEIDVLLKAQGLNTNRVGQRLGSLAADPKYLYDNTDTAKEKLIADLNAKVVTVQAKLPRYFGALPKAKVEIRRVPKNIEAGAPGGYYQAGSLDGARPGAYYINLRDTAELPSWGLSTLTYHEAIPGHHLQITLANEMPALPLIRKIVSFSGYVEGWALYAEQLAVEIGMYDNDPLGHIGQLQAALFRAVRLVVDSGMHAKGWSRERATAFYVDHLGEKESAAITEIERYCVWPGQACSYMLGKLTWLRTREKARQALGAKFDLKSFHDAGLLTGALPLTVLEQAIDGYIARA